MALSWWINDGGVDRDVTDHISNPGSFVHADPGGPEQAQVDINLPASDFGPLGSQTRVWATAGSGDVVWDGFMSDPGSHSGDDGEMLQMSALGSKVIGTDKLEPLIYQEIGTEGWSRQGGTVETATVDIFPDSITLAFQQGYAIATDARAAAIYQQVRHGSQPLAGIAFSLIAGMNSTAYGFQVIVYKGGGVPHVDYTGLLSTSGQTIIRTNPTMYDGTVESVALHLYRVGGATNVSDGLVFVRIADLKVFGQRLDRYGVAQPVVGALSSAQVIEDLIGRGMLGRVAPHAASIETTGVAHYELSWPGGVRGSSVLTALAAAESDMTWTFGYRSDIGYSFEWRSRRRSEPRYILGGDDTISRPGGEDETCQRVAVTYIDAGNVPRRIVVTKPEAVGGIRIRDAEPITSDATTEAGAIADGLELLDALAYRPASGAAIVTRRLYDRWRGLEVDPWEIRPGCYVQIERTGEVVRLSGVSYNDDDVAATLQLGSQQTSLEDRITAMLADRAAGL